MLHQVRHGLHPTEQRDHGDKRTGSQTVARLGAHIAPHHRYTNETPEPVTSLDPQSEYILRDAVGRAPGSTARAATSVILSDGGIDDEALSQLATELSIEPEVARARLVH